MAGTEGITLGNAAYALRRFSLREFFETSKKMGLPAVEVHYDWLVGEASMPSRWTTRRKTSRYDRLCTWPIQPMPIMPIPILCAIAFACCSTISASISSHGRGGAYS